MRHITRSLLKKCAPDNVRRLARYLGLGGLGHINLVIQAVLRRMGQAR